MSIKVPGGETIVCPVLEKQMEECQPHCKKFLQRYDTCVEKLGPEPPKGTDCQMQYFDYYRCVDHCTPKKLFTKLK